MPPARAATPPLRRPQAKKLKAQARDTSVASTLPELPSLRPYQRDAVGRVLAGWGLLRQGALPDATAAERRKWATAAQAAARPNCFIQAPTNSGKTRIFIEVTRCGGALVCGLEGAGAVHVLAAVWLLVTSGSGRPAAGRSLGTGRSGRLAAVAVAQGRGGGRHG
jgi:hypothetical protein